MAARDQAKKTPPTRSKTKAAARKPATGTTAERRKAKPVKTESKVRATGAKATKATAGRAGKPGTSVTARNTTAPKKPAKKVAAAPAKSQTGKTADGRKRPTTKPTASKQRAAPTPKKSGAAKATATKRSTAKATRKVSSPSMTKNTETKKTTGTKVAKPKAPAKATIKQTAKTTVEKSAKATAATKGTAKKTTKSAKPAKAAAGKTATSEAKGAAAKPKGRSEHLKKLLALKEAKSKIRKSAEASGLSTAVNAAEAAAEQAAQKQEKAARKRRKKAPYSKSELKELQLVLEEERDRILRDLRSLDDIAESNRETTHATFSSHQADAASDSSAFESTFIQRRYEEERFAYVSEALLRIENGTFGLCDFCVDEPRDLCETCPYIPIGRLRAKPFAKVCVQLRQQFEKERRNRNGS